MQMKDSNSGGAKRMFQHLTMRGSEFNMAAFSMNNPDAMVIGNASMNAQGDLVDNNGKVVKRRSEIIREWQQEQEKQRQVTRVDIKKGLDPDDFVDPLEVASTMRYMEQEQQRQRNTPKINHNPPAIESLQVGKPQTPEVMEREIIDKHAEPDAPSDIVSGSRSRRIVDKAE